VEAVCFNIAGLRVHISFLVHARSFRHLDNSCTAIGARNARAGYQARIRWSRDRGKIRRNAIDRGPTRRLRVTSRAAST